MTVQFILLNVLAEKALFDLTGKGVLSCACLSCIKMHSESSSDLLGAHIQHSWRAELLKLVGYGGTPVVPLCQRCHNCQGAEIKLKETSYIVDRGGSSLDLRGMPNARFGQQRLQELSCMGDGSLRFTLQLYGLSCEIGSSHIKSGFKKKKKKKKKSASTAMMSNMLYDLEVAWGLA